MMKTLGKIQLVKLDNVPLNQNLGQLEIFRWHKNTALAEYCLFIKTLLVTKIINFNRVDYMCYQIINPNLSFG